MPEKTGKKQEGTRWRPGQSGNPNGRPKGARNKASIVAENLLDGESPAIIRKLISQAKKGQAIALKLVIERIVPKRGRAVEITDLPAISRASDIAEATGAVVRAAAEGELTLQEAEAFMRLLAAHRAAVETADLAVRIEALERGDDAKASRYAKLLGPVEEDACD